MMSNFFPNNYFVLLLFSITSLLDYAEFTYQWQLKEYRLDRFRDFLSTVLGEKFIFSYKVIFRPILFLLLLLGLSAWLKFATALAIIFSFDLLDSLIKLARRRLNRPKITAKAALIIASSILLEAIILYTANIYVFLLALVFSRFIIISLALLAINQPANLIKKYYYRKAAKKLAHYDKLSVIGVTGSYGKTTVKNFLKQILRAKFRVIKTPKNINTELGIAKFILNTDFSRTDIFIVEMAAYRIGEIKLICDMVKPIIGILTAINEQHLPLFGNIKNTQTAKYELLRNLPPEGLAIVNSDNKYCREYLGELKCQVKTFGQIKDYNPDCLIGNINTSADKLEFQARLDVEKLADNYEIKTNIIGSHNAMNIAPVLLSANYLGLPKLQITAQCLKLNLPPATMQIVNYGSSVIIDDSYNANPKSFTAALEFLKNYQASGKKIVISRGMIELGEASAKAHEKIGKLIGQIADEFIIISPDSVASLKSGAGDSNLKIQIIFDPYKLLEYIKQNKNLPNIILLEGRVPEIIKIQINALKS